MAVCYYNSYSYRMSEEDLRYQLDVTFPDQREKTPEYQRILLQILIHLSLQEKLVLGEGGMI